MPIEFRSVSVDDGMDFYEMLQEIPAEENGFLNPVHGKSAAEYRQWLAQCEASATATGLQDGWKVPQTTYWLCVDGRPAGIGRIRHFLTDKLREEGGHTGYAVRPGARHHGYGTLLLGKLAAEAGNLGIHRMLLTIRKDNVYSLKAALANHGVIERQTDVRYFVWVDCRPASGS